MSQIIAKIEKSSLDEIIVQLTNFRGHDLIDVRIWTKNDVGEKEAKPTKKGISLKPDEVSVLIKALQKADKAYRENAGNN